MLLTLAFRLGHCSSVAEGNTVSPLPLQQRHHLNIFKEKCRLFKLKVQNRKEPHLNSESVPLPGCGNNSQDGLANQFSCHVSAVKL